MQMKKDKSSKMNRDDFEKKVPVITLIGLGLLGGSLAKSIRRFFPKIKIHAYARRDETLQQAKDTGLIDYGSTNYIDVLEKSCFIIICIPIPATIDFFKKYAINIKDGTVITDIGSVKGDIICEARKALRGREVNFIGSHPMAGAETSGLEHARDNLYDGAIIFLTPLADDDSTAVKCLQFFWEGIAAKPNFIDYKQHDQLVSCTSHALHYVSSATVKAYLHAEKADLATGGAFRDFSRIAASDPGMWCDIAKHNKDNILDALASLQDEVKQIVNLIENDKWNDMYNYLDEAKDIRAKWFAQWQARREK